MNDRLNRRREKNEALQGWIFCTLQKTVDLGKQIIRLFELRKFI